MDEELAHAARPVRAAMEAPPRKARRETWEKRETVTGDPCAGTGRRGCRCHLDAFEASAPCLKLLDGWLW